MIRNVSVVNEGRITVSDVLIKNGRIERIGDRLDAGNIAVQEINGEGKHLLPGIIDDQVHFREPGLTHKASIYTESKAAVAGGVTSYMEMPNTIPNTLTQDLLEDKYVQASKVSLANYSFYMGTGNDNAEEVLKTNEKKDRVCGVKIFMGSSTGNMLVDNPATLDRIFRDSELLIATHCEDERIIRNNLDRIRKEKTILDASDHPRIRDEEACFQSSLLAIQIAKKYDTRLHILHISTAKELMLFTNMRMLPDKRITAEVCVHHLHFTADDYAILGNRIKCNPAIKAGSNKKALWEALLDDRLDVIATDHAPHLSEEKQQPYEKAPAGLPLVQHSLQLMLYYYKKDEISLERIVEKMCHAVATCFRVKERGFIREGYMADLVMLDLNQSLKVSRENILYKCGWSPLEGVELPGKVTHTFVNGNLVVENGVFKEEVRGERLLFDG